MRLVGIIQLMPLLVLAAGAVAQPDTTSFQAAAPFSPRIDVGADMVMVYGTHNFAERAGEWKRRGYTVSMMTGISWGNYENYYVSPEGRLKVEEIQTEADGAIKMHGNSKTVGYNVPSDDYVEYIKAYVNPAIDWGVKSVFLEEPEYWAYTGWSEGFKGEWERAYGAPWVAPDSSPAAQWKASNLKYELYFDALKEVFAHVKERDANIECHVPTHSLINYAHWRIVTPMAHLVDIPELDGYIAQVWTGTARTPNLYRGVRKERTFETAYFEYGQMAAMTVPTGKKVWFLADPIEDNPNHTWADYRMNYEKTVVASLMWPEVARYEVMPWPNRIFNGTYPSEEGDDRIGMPDDYETELLAVINALNDMDQDDVSFHGATDSIGLVVSDTLMFQRHGPGMSDGALSHVYGLAMPLLKAGVRLRLVQLESIGRPASLEGIDVLLLSYEGQKPMKAAYNKAIANWVKDGGSLVYVGDGSDAYHAVPEWWNNGGDTGQTAYGDLFARLGIGDEASNDVTEVGSGLARIVDADPAALARDADGAAQVIGYVEEIMAAAGRALNRRNYLHVRRGPYHAVSVFDESVSEDSYVLTGRLVDLFDPALPVRDEVAVPPGDEALVYDLAWEGHEPDRYVAAAAGRIRRAARTEEGFHFTARGPTGTRGAVRIVLPERPNSITTAPVINVDEAWDEESGSLLLQFPHVPGDVFFKLR